MSARPLATFRLLGGGLAALAMLLAGYLLFGDQVRKDFLDPKRPFLVYRPPVPPDYRRASSWALVPGTPSPGDPPVDVFFVHPTTFDGGRDWNGPITARESARLLDRVMLPNYAAPFAAAGRVFAPRYRQASLYAWLTLFDDAVEAREFAYRDVAAAFTAFRSRTGDHRPFILVGVEQGGSLVDRLLTEAISPDPTLRRRLVAAYLIETAVPADDHAPGAAIPACRNRAQAGCVAAWISAPWLDFGRSKRLLNRSRIWSAKGHLVGLQGRRPLCVNPLIGGVSDAAAPARLNLGAANATGLEWGARPGFLARQVEARCVDGILRISTPRSSSLRERGGWSERLKAPPFNLFWADLEADAVIRERSWASARGLTLSPGP